MQMVDQFCLQINTPAHLLPAKAAFIDLIKI